MNYLNKLKNDLYAIKVANNIDCNLEIADYQDFVKIKKYTDNTIYVVVKYLSSDISFKAKIQPINILVISEQNSVEKSMLLFQIFAKEHNWKAYQDGTTFIKESYSDPVSLSNFEDVAGGYRSSLYVSGELYIMEDVIDISEVKINNVLVDAIGFTMSYSMQGNSQQLATEYLSSTVKSTASLTIGMTIPMVSSYSSTQPSFNVVQKILDIVNGADDGNFTFTINYKVGGTYLTTAHNMKLIKADIVTAPDQVPSLNIGFMR